MTIKSLINKLKNFLNKIKKKSIVVNDIPKQCFYQYWFDLDRHMENIDFLVTESIKECLGDNISDQDLEIKKENILQKYGKKMKSIVMKENSPQELEEKLEFLVKSFEQGKQ